MICGAARVAPEKAVFRPVLPMSPLPGISEMHVNHGAIETEYGGYRFRSRLEARWAVFFDALGIEWKYETQGFEAEGHRYLPDFYLPESDDWVEVKGDALALHKDLSRMRVMLGSNSPLPGIAAGKSQLVLLGEIPYSENLVLHPCLGHEEGKIVRRHVVFLPAEMLNDKTQGGAMSIFDQGALARWCGIVCADSLATLDDKNLWSASHASPVAPRNIAADAYRTARHARFEHGQSGATPATSRGR